MIRHLASLAVLSSVLSIACASAPPAPSEPETDAAPDWAELAVRRLPSMEVCELPNAPEAVLCGTITVPEDRTAEGGRQLDLKVVVVPAQAETPPNEGIFVFEGGPGGAATKRALGSIYSGPLRARDIVLIDQRGTGESNPLQCDLGQDAPTEPGTLREMLPAARVRACADELAERADVRLYGSAEHADDVEAVRRALGYDSIHVRGGSYGGRAAMVYAARNPEVTRSLFAIATDAPLRSNLAERSESAEAALRGVAALCAASPECVAISPDLHAQVTTLLHDLERAPRTVTFADPVEPATELTIEVGRGWMSEMLRLNLYYAFTSKALPWAVHRALDTDDWQPLLQMAVGIERSFKSNLAYGVLLTVQCGEGMEFDVAAALDRGRDSLFGTYRLAQQVQGCANWPHDRRPPVGVDDPKPLDVPALFLSGALDAVTPSKYSEEARELFPNSVHIVLPEGQHGPFDLENGWTCVHEMWGGLVASGSVDGLDTSCAETMTRPPFVIGAEAFESYRETELAPMAQ